MNKFLLYPFKPGEILKLKKMHPCGNNIWAVIRVGQEVTIKCEKCSHIVSLSRKSLEKSIKTIEQINNPV